MNLNFEVKAKFVLSKSSAAEVPATGMKNIYSFEILLDAEELYFIYLIHHIINTINHLFLCLCLTSTDLVLHPYVLHEFMSSLTIRCQIVNLLNLGSLSGAMGSKIYQVVLL